MAVTGLGFIVFLAGHLAGNLTLYISSKAFNDYAHHLHSLQLLVTFAEIGLLIFATIHILTGVTLYFQNLRARPSRYIVNKNAGGRTIGSATMPYTGLLLIIFIVIHLINFHFVDKSSTTIYDIVASAFSKPGYVVFYVIAMIITVMHVSHGFWSAFQTLGIDHPKYTPIIKFVRTLYTFAVGIGLGLIPIYIFFVG